MMPDPKVDALHQLRVRAAGIAAMRSVIQELEDSPDPSRSRITDLQHLQSALADSWKLFVREMHDALEHGASKAEISEATGMSEQQVASELD
jgi:hypothetical protein